MKGNKDIVEWLCSDERIKCFINEGCPVGWVCYTGQVEIGRKFVALGADSKKTTCSILQSSPSLLAAENGQLESMKILAEELGHEIKMVGPTCRNNFECIKSVPHWNEIEGHDISVRWAK